MTPKKSFHCLRFTEINSITQKLVGIALLLSIGNSHSILAGPPPLGLGLRISRPKVPEILSLDQLRVKYADDPAASMVLSNPLHIRPMGRSIDGGIERPMILVQVKDLHLVDINGMPLEWIPFYQSSGTFSHHPGAWFPFYGVGIRRDDEEETGSTPTLWVIETLNRYRGQSNVKVSASAASRVDEDFGRDDDFYTRNEEDPILSLLSARLARQLNYDSASKHLIYERQSRALAIIDDAQVNDRIGEAGSYFGRNIGLFEKTAEGECLRAEYIARLSAIGREGSGGGGDVDMAEGEEKVAKKPSDHDYSIEAAIISRLPTLSELPRRSMAAPCLPESDSFESVSGLAAAVCGAVGDSMGEI